MSVSRFIFPPISNVKAPASDIVDPSIVISSTVRAVRVPTLVILVCAAVVSVPAIVVAVSAPFTSSKVLGVAVPIPTRLALASTTKVPLSILKSCPAALVSNICGVIFVSAIFSSLGCSICNLNTALSTIHKERRVLCRSLCSYFNSPMISIII